MKTLLLLVAVASGQPPDPWLHDATEAIVRRVHEGPNEGRSTVWVRLRPRLDGGQPGPTALVFVAQFTGRVAPPAVPVQLHVMSDVRISPLVPRVERLVLTLDGAQINLLGPGEPTTLAHCCGDMAVPIGATHVLDPERFARVADASSIEGEAFGVRFSLSRSETAALKALQVAVRGLDRSPARR